ncbi:MAG: hypothetical protein ACYTEZ_05250 [Planctomycetota bacterium]|jgi:hypothetical protein
MRCAALLPFALLLGCSLPGKNPGQFTQAQLNAIETREVEAAIEETFNAAAEALFDAGYVISVSDRDAGILTGFRSVDRTAERIWLSRHIRDRQYLLSLNVREVGPERCTVRIQLAINGEARVDKPTIDQIWVLMQRQVLMKEPPRLEP